MRTLIFACLVLWATACSKPAPSGQGTPAALPAESAGADAVGAGVGGRREFIVCKPDARGAEMCTMDYSPVCGQHADSKPPQTYPNICGACKDANVTGYFTGECESGANE
jgi:hypothetical protein